MNNTPPSYPLNNSLPPEYIKSPQPKLSEVSSQKVFQQPYTPIETHHIYHSPLRSAPNFSNTTPIRYLSPAKISDAENSHYLLTRAGNDPETVFFLRKENDRLKLALRDKQDELNSFIAKCSHLERHMKDPTFVIKLEENELRLQAVIRENMRLHEELTQKSEEIQSWKNAFTRIDATMGEKISDFENTNNELRAELESWKQKVADLEKKLELKDEMFNKYLNENNGERQEKIKQAGVPKTIPEAGINEDQYNELIEKMGVLIKENEKLNFLLEQKMEEFDKLRSSMDQQNYDLEQWKNKYQQLNFSYDELQRRSWDDEDKIRKLTSELENINSLLKAKFSMLEDWKAKYLKLGQISDKLKDYKNKIFYLTDDNIKLNSAVKSKVIEIEALKNSTHRLELQLNNEKNVLEELKIKHTKTQNLEESLALKNQRLEFENQMSSQKTENERLNESIRSLKQENTKMEYFRTENIKLTGNIEELNAENANLRNHYLENHKLIQKNQELNTMIVVFFAEIEGLRARIREKEEELEILKAKIYGKK